MLCTVVYGQTYGSGRFDTPHTLLPPTRISPLPSLGREIEREKEFGLCRGPMPMCNNGSGDYGGGVCGTERGRKRR
jgi:hypothetical protein